MMMKMRMKTTLMISISCGQMFSLAGGNESEAHQITSLCSCHALELDSPTALLALRITCRKQMSMISIAPIPSHGKLHRR
jgi:hypothetical protein